MKDGKWLALVVITLVIAIVAMFLGTSDQETRSHILGLMDRVVTFVVGATVGGAAVGLTPFLRRRLSKR